MNSKTTTCTYNGCIIRHTHHYDIEHPFHMIQVTQIEGNYRLLLVPCEVEKDSAKGITFKFDHHLVKGQIFLPKSVYAAGKVDVLDNAGNPIS